MTQITANIDLSFEHTTPDGDMTETLINVTFCYYPAQHERGPSYASSGEPAEPASWEYQSASFLDEKGIWRDLAIGEWLDVWAEARFDACDSADIEN